MQTLGVKRYEHLAGDQRFQITPVAVPNRKILWNGKLFE
jgi:hypothetical protein